WARVAAAVFEIGGFSRKGERDEEVCVAQDPLFRNYIASSPFCTDVFFCPARWRSYGRRRLSRWWVSRRRRWWFWRLPRCLRWLSRWWILRWLSRRRSGEWRRKVWPDERKLRPQF